MEFTLNQTGILEGSIVLPWNGSWVLDCMLDSDPQLVAGNPFSMLVDSQTQLIGETFRCLNVAGRIRFVGTAVGTALLNKPLVPLWMQSVSKFSVASQLLTQSGNPNPAA